MKFCKQSLLLIFIILAQFTFAGNQQNIDSANAAYSKNNFDRAIKLYKDIDDKGYEAMELYYNLGNSYFKTNNIPAAILYWEKALKLKPNDDDIKFNLKVANSRISDKIDPLPEIFIKRWWRNACNIFSSNSWATITLISFFVFLVFLTVFRLSRSLGLRKTSFYLSIIFLFISLLTASFAYQQYKNLKSHDEAIVFTPTVTIKSSPDENSTDLFVIHEGLKLQLLDNISDWYKIKIPNGSIGWLNKNDFEII